MTPTAKLTLTLIILNEIRGIAVVATLIWTYLHH